MTSPARLQELASMANDIGVDAAAKRLKVSRETVRRARRYAANSKAVPVDSRPADELAKKLVNAYSEAELKALLADSKKIHDRHRSARIDFSGQWYKFGVISDLHLGSNYTDDEGVAAAIEECTRGGCQMLIFPGDITEGMSGRDGHIYELSYIGYKAQRDAAVVSLSAFSGKKKLIAGNHDLWYASKGDAGAHIVEDICERLGPSAEFLGDHEGDIVFNGARVGVWHGEDGASYAISYRIQKIIESMEPGSEPQMIIVGHDHKSLFLPAVRNIPAIGAGCIQHQTPFMKRKKLPAHRGFWQVEICVRDAKIRKIKTEWTGLFRP